MSVSRETQERLAIFLREFERWNAQTNLSADTGNTTILERHVADSVQLTDIVGDTRSWIDIGSGGGFPGLIVAACRPDTIIELVESNNKKAAFLRQTALAMRLNVKVHAKRAELVVREHPTPDVVSARAVASLDRLLGLLEPWLANGTLGVFPKGRTYEAELREAQARWSFEVDALVSRTDPEARILLVRDLRPKTVPIVSS